MAILFIRYRFAEEASKSKRVTNSNDKISEVAKVSISTEIGLKFSGKSNSIGENIFCIFNLLFLREIIYF